ncbi:MAG TPA: hypothetical protein VM285_15365 [Polyangia bacterium]|nr:hypothetical protein [Polyangia bacterium]
MGCDLKCWFRSLLLMAFLFGALGGLGSYWWFFWVNREMSPCAPVGVDGKVAAGVEIAEPYSEDLLRRRSLVFAGVAALLGMGLAAALVGPRSRRLRRFAAEEDGTISRSPARSGSGPSP